MFTVLDDLHECLSALDSDSCFSLRDSCCLMLRIVLKPCQQNLTDLSYLCSSAHSYRYQFAVNTKPFSTASHRWKKLLWPLIKPHFYTGSKTGSHWTGCGKGACVHVNTPEASNGITTFIFSPTCITLVSPFLSSHLDTHAACPVLFTFPLACSRFDCQLQSHPAEPEKFTDPHIYL